MEIDFLYDNQPILAEIDRTSMRAYARRCGVDVVTVVRAREGANVTIETLHKLANGAEVSICKLLGCEYSHDTPKKD
jgi:hypothetical protein